MWYVPGVERSVGLQHCGRREVENSLTLPTMVGQVTYKSRAFTDHFPKIIDSLQQPERINIGLPANEFSERLSHDANDRSCILAARKIPRRRANAPTKRARRWHTIRAPYRFRDRFCYLTEEGSQKSDFEYINEYINPGVSWIGF